MKVDLRRFLPGGSEPTHLSRPFCSGLFIAWASKSLGIAVSPSTKLSCDLISFTCVSMTSFHVDTPLLLDPTDLLVGEDIFDYPIAAANLPLLINAHITAASPTATADSSDLTYRSRFLRLTRPLRSPRSPSSFQVHVSDETDPGNWHVQVFRSIDSGSVKGFPKDFKEAAIQNLVCGKNLKYFLGSWYYWPSYKNAGADNLIPMELALKIARKINDHQRFAVYIVIPLWPEGVPTSNAIQENLFWQVNLVSSMFP
ncbi:hypothetical protein ACFE04_002002 [Oxalis oulophora]